jgi:hypothetical protein
MRRFMVHFVTEIDFVDGDEASDDVVQRPTRSISGRLFRTQPRPSRSGRSRAPRSRMSWSKKSRLSSSPFRANRRMTRGSERGR